VQSQIETYVARKAQADYSGKLREAAKIERMEKPEEAAPSRREDRCQAGRRQGLQDGPRRSKSTPINSVV